jgi:hypothetical protein
MLTPSSEILGTHPELAFLQKTTQFQERYGKAPFLKLDHLNFDSGDSACPFFSQL